MLHSHCHPWVMLYPHYYNGQRRQNRRGTDRDGITLWTRRRACRARLGPVFRLRRPFRNAWLDPRRNCAVQDPACPGVVPVSGRASRPRVRPTRLDPGVPYRSLLLRDSTLAATIVAGMVGIALFFTTALQATLLAGTVHDYAAQAAPRIVSYVNEVRTEIREGRVERGASPEKVRDLPPPAQVSQVEATLQPPTLRDLGRSMANFILRAVLLGTAGGLVGVLRGRPGSSGEEKPGRTPRRE